LLWLRIETYRKGAGPLSIPLHDRAQTFFVNGEMFWGNDRLDFVEEALMRMA
jgi:hypothetical protein